jgi:hypothetical protein
VIIVFQYEENPLDFDLEMHMSLNALMQGKDLYVVDLWDSLVAFRLNDLTYYKTLYTSSGRHMSRKGNQMTAEGIKRTIIEIFKDK